jgi:hypothetical protein
MPKWPNSSQNRKLSDFQAEMNDLGQKVDLQQAYRTKSRKKGIGKSPQFPYRKPMCYLNKSKTKTNSHLIFLPIGKLIRDDSTKTGYTVVKKPKNK